MTQGIELRFGIVSSKKHSGPESEIDRILSKDKIICIGKKKIFTSIYPEQVRNNGQLSEKP